MNIIVPNVNQWELRAVRDDAFIWKGFVLPFKRRAGRLFWLKWDYVVNIFLLADLHTIITQQQVKQCADRIYLDFLSADWERSRKENVGFYSSAYLWNEQMSHFSSALILFSGSTDGNWCLTVFSPRQKQANLSLSVCQQRLAQTATFNAAFNVSVLVPREK